MPLRDAQRNALVKIIPGRFLGRGVHHPNQLVVNALLLVKQ
jgi:hypothetical protein